MLPHAADLSVPQTLSPYVLSSTLWCCRHPFPPTWIVPSNDSFTFEELSPGSDEFARVEGQLHASLPGATLQGVTRYDGMFV